MGKFSEALERSNQTKDSLKDSSTEAMKTEQQPTLDLIVMRNPESIIAEHFRFLRSQLLYPTQGSPPRTIAVTSSISGDGKTFVASNLAACIALGVQEHVLLIDCDLRNPNIHKVFKIDRMRKGLSSYLTDNAPLPGLLCKTSIQKLSIISSGNVSAKPSELLSSDRMRNLISEARDRYPDRFVILDTTPLELTPEASVLANQADAALLVVRYGKTPRKLVKNSVQRIDKTRLWGVVFNGDENVMKQYGRYGYGYYAASNKKRH